MNPSDFSLPSIIPNFSIDNRLPPEKIEVLTKKVIDLSKDYLSHKGNTREKLQKNIQKLCGLNTYKTNLIMNDLEKINLLREALVNKQHIISEKKILKETLPSDIQSEVLTTLSNTQSISLEERNWQNIKAVTKSSGGQGVKGVWFYIDENDKRIVVKDEIRQFEQAFATRFLAKHNFRPPRMMLISMNSEEGREIMDVQNKNFPLEQLKKAKAPNIERLKFHVRYSEPEKLAKNYFVVMEYSEGKSLANLAGIQKDKVRIKDPEFAKEIGRMYIYDQLLGNTDRFNVTTLTLNDGNIMIDDFGIVPIDQGCSPCISNNLSNIKAMTERIINNSNLTDADKLSKILETLFKKKKLLQNNERIDKNALLSGMKQAIKEIAEIPNIKEELAMINEQLLNETSLQETPLERANTNIAPSILESIQSRAQIIKDIYNINNNEVI